MNKINGGLKNAIIASKTISKNWHNNQFPGVFLKLYNGKLYVHYDNPTSDVVEEFVGQGDFAVNNMPVYKFSIKELEEIFK
jgi:hypothetical protein